MVDEFICPMMEDKTQFGKAHWEIRGIYRCCSHCGSMHPDDAIQAVKDLGSEIMSPSTKGYKFYVRIPGVKNASEGPVKFYTPHFNNGQRFAYNAAVEDLKQKKRRSDMTPLDEYKYLQRYLEKTEADNQYFNALDALYVSASRALKFT